MSESTDPSRRNFLTAGAAVTAAAVTGAAGFAIGRSGSDSDGGDSSAQGAGGGTDTSGPMPTGPNVLFIMVDEMRYPPVYESEALKLWRKENLPAQEALRAGAVEFHRHYTASMACGPARTSLFTGQYPSFHGVTQTSGAAKASDDPDLYWLAFNSVPTLGNYFQSAGYRSLYRGKWHISDADLTVPGSRVTVNSYTDTGERDLEREALYQEADRLAGYGFEGWIGPEPHGSKPLNSASSAKDKLGRDQGFAAQVVELIERLDSDDDDRPWFMVASFLDPHDIALWGYGTQRSELFDFSVDESVPEFADLFDTEQFALTMNEDLSSKPASQRSYQETYKDWMQDVPPENYLRYYYSLHKRVDAQIAKVHEAIKASRFYDDTIIVFTSDHGDLLGSHGFMHQKWHQAYDEALRVPLFISTPETRAAGGDGPVKDVESLTSHADLVPTLLAMTGIDPEAQNEVLAERFSDVAVPVGRDISDVVTGSTDKLSEPIFFMTDDEPSRGNSQENIFGVGYDSVVQPNHIECVIAEIDGEIWKFARYFDNPQFWSDPAPFQGPPKDVVEHVAEAPEDAEGTVEVTATKRIKFEPEPEEFELYNVTADPLELTNLADDPAYADRRSQLSEMLDAEREAKRLNPVSGQVPGQG